MGAESKAKAARRDLRRIRDELERAGVTERARHAFLGLKREDVQAAIKALVNEDAPWNERPSFDDVARQALESFGYDLDGVKLSVKMKPGNMAFDGKDVVQLPPTYVYVADASEEAIAAACTAAGIKTFKGTHAAPTSN